MRKGIKSKLCITRIGYDSEDRFQLNVDQKEENAALRYDLERLWLEYNQAKDNTTHVESEYLEVIAARS